MQSCTDLSASYLRRALAGGQTNARCLTDLTRLPAELTARIFVDQRSCEAIYVLLRAKRLNMRLDRLVLLCLPRDVNMVFRNVTRLCVAVIPADFRESMPGVETLELEPRDRADSILWSRLGKIMPNVVDFRFRSDKITFGMTAEWLDGSLFPKLLALRIQAASVLWETKTAVQTRRIVVLDVETSVIRNHHAWGALLDPQTIRSFASNNHLPQSAWWTSVRLTHLSTVITKHNVHLSGLLRDDGTSVGLQSLSICIQEFGTVSADEGVALFRLMKQERSTLTKFVCVSPRMLNHGDFVQTLFGRLGGPVNEQAAECTAHIMTANPGLDRVKIIYPGRRRTSAELFASTPEHEALIAHKLRRTHKQGDYAYFVAQVDAVTGVVTAIRRQ